MRFKLLLIGLILFLVPVAICLAQQQVKATPELVRSLVQSRQYANAEKAAYIVLWDDIEQPDVLQQLAAALSAQRKTDDAAVYLTWWLRLAEKPTYKIAEAQKKTVAADLKKFNVAFEAQQKKHAEAAASRVFESAEKVDDLWMTDVTVDLFSYYMLHHWVVVGGAKDRPAHWSTGTMHRSGARLLEQYEGRKGVLYTKTIMREEQGRGNQMHEKHYKRLGRTPRIQVSNPAALKILRIGARGDSQPFLLVVHAGGKEVASEKISADKWHDLRIDLADAAAKNDLTLELTVPPGQKYSGEAAFDYVELYKD